MHFQVEASEAFILAYTTCWCLFFWVTTSGFKHSLVFVIANSCSIFVYCGWALMIHVVSENAIYSKTGWFGEIGNNVFAHFLEIESTYDSEKLSISDKWTSIILVKSCQDENNNLWMHTYFSGSISCGFQPNSFVDPRSNIVSMLNHIFWDKRLSHRIIHQGLFHLNLTDSCTLCNTLIKVR